MCTDPKEVRAMFVKCKSFHLSVDEFADRYWETDLEGTQVPHKNLENEKLMTIINEYKQSVRCKYLEFIENLLKFSDDELLDIWNNMSDAIKSDIKLSDV